MAPKLYSILASPPVRSVLLCAKVLGIELEVVSVNLLAGEHLTEEYLKKNPLHTVPVLEDDDGFIVTDSHAIMVYLVSKYGKNDSLYPKDVKQRAAVDQALYFDTGILTARSLFITRPLGFYGTKPSQEKLDGFKEAYQFLEQILADNKTDYVAGNSLSIADFSIITAITSGDLFIPYADYPHIKAYVERFQKLPCYEVNKEGLKMFFTMFQGLLNA